MKVYDESESFPVTNELFFPSGVGAGESQQWACEGVCLARDLPSGHLEEGVAGPSGKVLGAGGRGELAEESCGRREPGRASGWAAGWAQLFEGSLCSPPGRWEGVLFKRYHLIFIFGCGWAC